METRVSKTTERILSMLFQKLEFQILQNVFDQSHFDDIDTDIV